MLFNTKKHEKGIYSLRVENKTKISSNKERKNQTGYLGDLVKFQTKIRISLSELNFC